MVAEIVGFDCRELAAVCLKTVHVLLVTEILFVVIVWMSNNNKEENQLSENLKQVETCF